MNIATGEPGLLGKVPAHADFVRLNHREPAVQDFERWLEEAHEALRPLGATFAPWSACFLFTAPAAPRGLVGVMAPSQDRVGRVFPLAVFVPVDLVGLAGQVALVPLAFAAFLGQARELLADAAGLDATALGARLARLLPPSSAEWRLAREQGESILALEAGGFFAALERPGHAGGPAYAFRTLLSACAQAKGDEGQMARVTLDCPVPGVGPLPWLSLAAQQLGWRQRSPSFLWAETPSPRLLVSLGGTPAAWLKYLVCPEKARSGLWPLVTEQSAAMTAALDALTPEQRRAFQDPAQSLSAVLAATHF